MTDGFVFYNSFYEALKNLEPEDRLAAYDAICAYALKDDASNAQGVVGAILALVKPQIDANKRKREAGKLGGTTTQAQLKHNSSTTQAEREQVEAKVKVKEKEKVKEKVKEKENPLDAVELSPAVKEVMGKWLEYKRERREAYKDVGLRALLSQVQNAEQRYGAKAVVDVVELSMSNGWRGIIWDRLDRARSGTNPFTAVKKRDYDFDAIERALGEA